MAMKCHRTSRHGRKPRNTQKKTSASADIQSKAQKVNVNENETNDVDEQPAENARAADVEKEESQKEILHTL